MPGLGKSGTSRINDFRWSIVTVIFSIRNAEYVPVGSRIDLFNVIYDGPLRPRSKIVLERFNAARRSFGKRFDCSIGQLRT